MPAHRSPSRTSAAARTPEPPAAPITSKDNRWLKRFRAALAGESVAPNVIGIEGPHLLEEALRVGWRILVLHSKP